MNLISIATAEIESQLTQIWEGLEGANKTRACLFNLLFFTKRNARTDYVRKVALNIIEKFPARVIMVIADPEAKNDFINTKISVLAPNKGEPDVACDWIEMEISENMLERASFTVLPHILPDLPLYLILEDDPTLRNPLLSQVSQFTSRFILDSETAQNLTAFAKASLKIREESAMDIADLNWARTESWRDILSSIFNAPDRLAQLPKIEKMLITYNAIETAFFCHLRIQALYLQAWFASRLGWRLASAFSNSKGISLNYTQNGRKISVELQPEKKTTCYPGMVLSLAIQSQDNCYYEFSAPENSPECIRMMSSTPTSCEIPSLFIFPKAEFGQSLVREICHPGTSAHYLDVLKFLAQMDAKLC